MKTVEKLIRTYHLERTAAVAEGIATLIARAWAEVKRPPRPAYIIVAVRTAKRPGEVTLRFAP